jgi:hypothetical protein
MLTVTLWKPCAWRTRWILGGMLRCVEMLAMQILAARGGVLS